MLMEGPSGIRLRSVVTPSLECYLSYSKLIFPSHGHRVTGGTCFSLFFFLFLSHLGALQWDAQYSQSKGSRNSLLTPRKDLPSGRCHFWAPSLEPLGFSCPDSRVLGLQARSFCLHPTLSACLPNFLLPFLCIYGVHISMYTHVWLVDMLMRVHTEAREGH